MKTVFLFGVSAVLIFLFYKKWNKNVGQPSLPVAPKMVGSKINGLTCVAPPVEFRGNPMDDIKKVGANWIAVVPYAFSRKNEAKVYYQPDRKQWWGERPEGVRRTIELAHAAGIQVMLKPQVWIPGGWVGELFFEDSLQAQKWEEDYEQYLLFFAQLAEKQHVEMLCIGTEFCQMTLRRPDFWRQLIAKVRKIYSGKLTYSANWDDWERVPFWSELDFIGLGAYFPLLDTDTPRVDDLVKAWQSTAQRLEQFSFSQKKPILFTEYGYLSVSRCAWRNWELEQDIHAQPINETAQSNSLEALHTVFQAKNWWAGGFLWKWFPENMGHEGYFSKDYTPQGKQAELILRHFFHKNEAKN